MVNIEISLSASVVFLLVCYYIANCVGAWQRLRHIPGPFWARWSRIWLIKQIYGGVYMDKIQELHAQYGPVVILAPDFLSVSDPGEIKRISGVRSVWGRGTPYLGFRSAPGKDSLFSVRDRKANDKLRGMLMGGYTGRSVESVEAMVDEHVLKLEKLIEDKYIMTPSGYRPVDFGEKAMYMTMDVISCFAFRNCFGCLERDSDFHTYLKVTQNVARVLASLCVMPLFQAFMSSPSLKWLLPKGGFFDPIIKIARAAVSERYGPDKKQRSDVLGAWVAAGLTEKEAEVETVGQLAATAMRATMLYLLSNPGAYQKLQGEIDHFVRSKAISQTAVLPEGEIKNWLYLEAVVKEALRIFPPVAMMPRSAAVTDTLCGLTVPPNTNVDLAVKPALRSTSIFGQDADLFRPERWIEVDVDTFKQREETLRFVFGGPSRRECPGKGLALLQLHKTFFDLFRCFDFTIPDPVNPWKAVNTRIWNISDMNVRVTRRE
ncbi:Uu.00g132330.m01.CDS01 [Anthostomella pinea]|uniref:Uu.00g132330.m01.CDS01 n=1 Tax=Anthostomella pinea TaxID=933095 RepID=A0AAI8VJ10_9PEZI|nr:Uu.00g132330.m01.CDS01 [Anthostomella pinea]